jgi:hypothetical protein
MHAQTSPTASEDPAIIEWQKASAKYAGARAAILKEVDLLGRTSLRPMTEKE